MAKKIFHAHYESRNFTFDAFGTTAAGAREALLEGLKNHAIQFQTDEKHWWYDDDIWVEERIVGRCYRDFSIIKQMERCKYCEGNCPNDEDHACDGYLGDLDGLYKEEV